MAVLSFARSRAVGSSSTPGLRGKRTLSQNPSAQTTGEDDQPVACGHVSFQPDVPDGHDDDPELSGGARAVARPQWHVARGLPSLGLRSPAESVFGHTQARDGEFFSAFHSSLCSGCLEENC